jgi:hypothetical protein
MEDKTLIALLQGIADTQKKTAETLDKLEKRISTVEGLKIDPEKLVASTKGIAPTLTVVQPKQDGPNLIEPQPLGADGRPVSRACYRCGQMYTPTGTPHC